MPHEPQDDFLDPIRRHVAELGYELWELRRVGTRERPVLQVRVDLPESRPGHGVTIAECSAISRSLERLLEDGGRVGPRYVLEVSSPGLERPLLAAAHWRRYAGQRAKVKAAGLEGRPTVEILEVPDDGHVTVRLPDGAVTTLALADVAEARVVADWSTIGKRR